MINEGYNKHINEETLLAFTSQYGECDKIYLVATTHDEGYYLDRQDINDMHIFIRIVTPDILQKMNWGQIYYQCLAELTPADFRPPVPVSWYSRIVAWFTRVWEYIKIRLTF